MESSLHRDVTRLRTFCRPLQHLPLRHNVQSTPSCILRRIISGNKVETVVIQLGLREKCALEVTNLVYGCAAALITSTFRDTHMISSKCSTDIVKFCVTILKPLFHWSIV